MLFKLKRHKVTNEKFIKLGNLHIAYQMVGIKRQK